MLTGTWSQREYSSPSVKAAKVTSGGVGRSTCATTTCAVVDPIGGYSILEAESQETLSKVLEDHPHKAMGGTIQTLECLQMPGM